MLHFFRSEVGWSVVCWGCNGGGLCALMHVCAVLMLGLEEEEVGSAERHGGGGGVGVWRGCGFG